MMIMEEFLESADTLVVAFVGIGVEGVVVPVVVVFVVVVVVVGAWKDLKQLKTEV